MALVLVAVWVMGRLVAQWLEPPVKVLLPTLEQKTSEPSVISPQKPSYLFGKPEALKATESVSKIDQEALKKTRLNIKLTGVLYTPDSSVAVIEEGRETYVLTEGEKLRQGVVIEEIQPKFIVLDNRGELERLMLDKSELAGSSAMPSRSTILSRSDKQDLQKIRASVRKSPLALNRYVRFRMLKRNGQVSSIQVWPRKERKLFESLGFKSGDKILQVDGRVVSSLADDPQQMKQLLQKTRFDLMIERKGRQQSLSVVLQ